MHPWSALPLGQGHTFHREDLQTIEIDDEFLLGCLKTIQNMFENLGGTDQVAKSCDFTGNLIGMLDGHPVCG